VRARWLCLAALAAGATCVAGCGETGASEAGEALGSQLAIYSSLPLQGPSAGVSQQIVGGEKLALARTGGRVGAFHVSYVSLDDSNPASGRWSPGVTAADARMAAQDTTTIAYLGEYESVATAVSLPLINAAGILQVSPSSPYIGLTSSLDAGPQEPERFYPSGRQTFARLAPGDAVEAAAQVALMKQLRVRRVYVLDDQDAFDVPLARILAADALRAGITLAAHDSLSTATGATLGGEVAKIVKSGAQAVFLAGRPGPGAVALWRQLHAADPQLLLLGASTLASEGFASQIASAGALSYLTTPALAPGSYPAAAQQVLAEYRRSFGIEADAYALYGYEAMSSVLQAIRDAGVRGDVRTAVIDAFFSRGRRDSVLGSYSIRPDGESTLTRYGVDRVRGGRLLFDRAIEAR
jgi:branched-chain amino acid transport system substrate-binding protein